MTAPTTRATEAWQCDACAEVHDSEDDDMAPAAWQRHIERLEEMGQQRLVP